MIPSLNLCYKVTVLREAVDQAQSAFFYLNHMLLEIDECFFDTYCKYMGQLSKAMVRQLANIPPTKWNTYDDQDWHQGSSPPHEVLN
jgi:hypothetical protein